MVYLDYSATTPINDEVLESYVKTTKDFIGNPNSLHNLGVKAKNLERQATKQIASLLNVLEEEIIYTSGASESNNMALKGIAYAYQKQGKHILTTKLEHSSIYGPLDFLKNNGFEIEYLNTNQDGLVTEDEIKQKLRPDTILVSITAVNSETGIRQPVETIGELLKKHSTLFHVDATQCLGKQPIDLTNIDLCSASAHKFYGAKGIGFLIKKKNVKLEPLIHGGKSTTYFRSGTPALPLIVSSAKALRLALHNQKEKNKKIKDKNNLLREELKKYDRVTINSNKYAIPHILNISVIGVKPETLQHALEEVKIYISTGSACSNGPKINQAILEVTKSESKAQYGVRISLSDLTTNKEIKYFLEQFDIIYNHLVEDLNNV